ncbi:Rne/Rng family ribonuclease [Brevibacillus daliensis]|uniref:Rne/Rng family ribonuclease n=1 Tax=Brevibacillus daliensis TaxID=2892995 RepID=UPI001E46C6A4|nr:Rne/Rng family ribonuclease [Brevibacillus daliensis]
MSKKQQGKQETLQIIVTNEIDETKIAIMENGRLAELWSEAANDEIAVGNIYKGRVHKVLPAMQAAFVKTNQQQETFLYIDEALPPGWKTENRGQEKPNIGQLVQVGEEKYIQISKEAMGTKVPRVTTEISLPGRLLVYLPFGQQVSLSRKITEDKKRKSLLAWAKETLQPDEGVILRTNAEEASEQVLMRELTYLRELWQSKEAECKDKKAPTLIYAAETGIKRLLMELSSSTITEVVVDDRKLYQELLAQAKVFDVNMVDKISFYQGKLSILEAYHVDTEIEKAMYRQVWLKQGGFLVIDQTEAMTVIDVNTGKFTGKSGQRLEETVTATNLEAADEIARQLRLRDIGGIIIIDFIDMKQASNRHLVLTRLQEALANDRTNSYVMGFTQLGLVEMTRKKVKENLLSTLTRTCITCGGKGRILREREVAGRLFRETKSLVRMQEIESVVIECHPNLVTYLHDEKRAEQFASEWGISLQVIEKGTIHPSEYHIVHAGSLADAKRFLT